jgi:predicted phage terminase large subunit-like protein
MAATVAPPAPSLATIEADQIRRQLGRFERAAWPIVERRHFRENWHLDVIAEHLEAVSAGELLRLIINIPPRHMKSLSVAVFWPCWDWLVHPERQWLFASYAEKLSIRDSVKCRRILESAGGRTEGGTLLERVGYRGLLALLGQDWELAGDQNEKLKYENTETGYRLATSVDGKATGEGGDILVIDDPHKAKEVESDAERKNVIEFLDGTLSTRLNDPATGAVVCVMQRLHEQDATGHLIEQGGYHHLCLPAEYEPTHPFVYPRQVEIEPRERTDQETGDVHKFPGRTLPGDPRTEAGELIWPFHFGREAVAELQLRLGSYRAAGQLQQRPAPAEGGILKTKWWRYYLPEWLEGDEWTGPILQRIWQSWDTASKEKTSSDFAVGGLWGQDGSNVYLLRRLRGRWGLTETITQVRQLTSWAAARWPQLQAHQIRIENAANGPEVIAALRNEIPGIVPVNADRDKVVKAEAITPQLEAGNIHVPGFANTEGTGPETARTPAWVQELLAEAAAFPTGANDDQVDMVTIGLDPRRMHQGGGGKRKARGGGKDGGQASRNR